VKVFISYATEDGSTAGSLDDDLHVAGAVTFLFGRSETSGETSWGEVLTWIEDCDVFVALISASALGSVPVQEEIEHAHYCYINSKRSKPSRLVPAILEAGAEPPILIKRFTRLDLTDYRTGLARLLDDLQLETSVVEDAAPPERRESSPAIDFEELITRTDRPSLRPPWEQTWSDDVAKILSNYDKLKPADLTETEEVDHIDSLLGKYSGKPIGAYGDPDLLKRADAEFLGMEPSEPPAAFPDLSEALLKPGEITRILLTAPTITATGVQQNLLTWDEVPGAAGYVVERRSDPDSLLSTEVESDTASSHLTEGPGYYRVKAKGSLLFEDSPWSNHVEAGAGETFGMGPSFVSGRTPSLTASVDGLDVVLEWSWVFGATGYVLERSTSPPMLLTGTADWSREPTYEVIYEGEDTSYTDNGAFMGSPTYRVKAKDVFIHGDSPWSDPVEPSISTPPQP
jgi:hypothetical protein